MNFELSEEQIQVRDMVREFAAREVAPHIQEWDAKGQFHREVLTKMGELGILGLPIPEELRRLRLRLRQPCPGLRRARVRRHLPARCDERPRRAQQPGAAPVGDRGAEAALADPAGPRREARHLWSDRAERWQRCRLHRDHRHPRRRFLHPQRRQDVDLAGRCRRSLPRLRQHRPLAEAPRPDCLHRRARHGRASPPARSRASSAYGPATPASSPSTTSASRSRTGSAKRARASRSR